MSRMLIRGIAAPALVLLATVASAADTAPAPAPGPASVANDAAKTSYALGYRLGSDMAGIDIRPDSLKQGLQDALAGKKAPMSAGEMTALLADLQKNVADARAKHQAEELQKTAAAGAAYLATNAKREGVKTTASGLQYSVTTAGTGRKPAATDQVTVNYKGTLVDGTEFDSSYSRGQPATFPVNGVIPGWTEALQMMQEGAKWQVAIPPALAYGDKGPLANQVLLFDIELIKVGPPEAAK